MNTPAHLPSSGKPARKQRGIVLFFALVALLVLSLAAVALIRMVDTSAIIAGNLAFKQAATNSGDTGIDAAITWMAGVQAAQTTVNVLTDANHTFNLDNAASGYYSSVHDEPSDPAYINLFADATWTNASSALVGTDPNTGNTIRYIIQRLCRSANTAVRDAQCLFSGPDQDTGETDIRLPQEVCVGPGCPAPGQAPITRITSRVTGPKNTVSYVQAFVY
jgi:Tfp pilus assembly protein PilX